MLTAKWKTIQLDLDDLIEELPPQTFRPHRSHQFTQAASSIRGHLSSKY